MVLNLKLHIRKPPHHDASEALTGRKFRATLIRSARQWYPLELCESLKTLIDPSAEFYGFEGSWDLITIIADRERSVCDGFRLLPGDPVVPAERDVQWAMLTPEDGVRSRNCRWL